jgi:hypothetical protein
MPLQDAILLKRLETVLDPLELAHMDSNQWWIATVSNESWREELVASISCLNPHNEQNA